MYKDVRFCNTRINSPRVAMLPEAVKKLLSTIFKDIRKLMPVEGASTDSYIKYTFAPYRIMSGPPTAFPVI